MYDVVLLTIEDRGNDRANPPRVPVLACADVLTNGGAQVETISADSDEAIDAVLARLDAPADDAQPRAGGPTPRPAASGGPRLVVATAADGQVRAVVRRMVRRYAPPPSRRPNDLPTSRTVPDLPPMGILPLAPSRAENSRDLPAVLGLPRTPAAVAAAVLDGRVRRLDLLRTDAGSVTLDGAVLGGADKAGRAVPWFGAVEVDDAVLSDGEDPLVACVVANAGGYSELSGVPMISSGDPADGQVEVAVAIAETVRTWWGRKRNRLEIRRARGRAVSVSMRGEALPYVDDGITGVLRRKQAWWIEAGAWAVYSG